MAHRPASGGVKMAEVQHRFCAHCANHHHSHCSGDTITGHPCDCRELEHQPDPELAHAMAIYRDPSLAEGRVTHQVTKTTRRRS